MKHVIQSEQFKQASLASSKKLFEVVSSTLGPRGKTVLLRKKDRAVPFATKDGVTVARFFEADNITDDLFVSVLKQASEKTNQLAGDGTTTTTVLAYALLQELSKYSKYNAYSLRKGIEQAQKDILEKISEISSSLKTLEDVRHIATISANGDEFIGNLITESIDKIGKDGSILIEESKSSESFLRILEGFRNPSGYVSNHFVTDERTMKIRYENPLVLLTDEKIEFIDQILPTLEIAARAKQPLVIVADDFEGEALAALILNSKRGTMKVCGIRSPKYGPERREIMKDLSLSLGASYITRENGITLKEVKLPHLGNCKSVEILKEVSVFVGGKGETESISQRIESLKQLILQTESITECEKYQEQITRLSSGIAVIYVGGATEMEVIEKKHRIEDALGAVRAAQEAGVVPGGGVVFFMISKLLSQKLLERITSNPTESELGEIYGYSSVLEAIKYPIKTIFKNAELDFSSFQKQIEELNKETITSGYNINTESYCNLIESGIIDPTKVLRVSILNAFSVVLTLLMSQMAIIED